MHICMLKNVIIIMFAFQYEESVSVDPTKTCGPTCHYVSAVRYGCEVLSFEKKQVKQSSSR